MALPTFTDDPLQARITLVKAVHLNELRRWIDELRVRFTLGAYTWTDATLVPGATWFTLAGANAMAKEDYFWLRSVGAWPKDYYGNFHVAGEANLRGYYNGTFAFKRILATNLELQLPFPLPVSRKTSRMLDRRLSIFYDAGRIYDERPLEGLSPDVRGTFDENMFDNFLTDFGVSVSLWKITAEFPIYVSDPQLVGGGEKWDFRWTVGFTRLF